MPPCSKPNFLKSKILSLETLHSVLVSNYTPADKYKPILLLTLTYTFSGQRSPPQAYIEYILDHHCHIKKQTNLIAC